ncbi:MAG: magnesium/cobalt transporter CorA [Chloroflexi bacterium]|nr:magnesium/cobalt transporter CorA [Chloroflexota bacterium]
MWTAYLLRPDGGPPAPVAQADLAAALQGPGFLWLDLEAPIPGESDLLNDPFRFHPLAIEDCILPRINDPKVDDYGAYLFVLVQGIDPRAPKDRPETLEVDLFVGPNYLVTFHLTTLPDLQTVRGLWLDSLWRSVDRPDSLAHLIVDRLVDGFLPAVEGLEERMEAVEDRVIRMSPQELSALLPSLRRAVSHMERVTVPQREVLYSLSHREGPLIQEKSLAYFRDIYDHLLRVETLLEGLHQRIDLVLQLHLAAVANRTNEVVKILSLVGTVFLPLTFLVGVYGMNFRHMPELEWRYGYFVVWGVMVAVTGGMLVYFRWRGWL